MFKVILRRAYLIYNVNPIFIITVGIWYCENTSTAITWRGSLAYTEDNCKGNLISSLEKLAKDHGQLLLKNCNFNNVTPKLFFFLERNCATVN